MTADELRIYFNDTFGLDQWPSTFTVSSETYGNVCDHLLRHKVGTEVSFTRQGCHGWGPLTSVSLWIGPNGGLLFKDVKLIREDPKPPEVAG